MAILVTSTGKLGHSSFSTGLKGMDSTCHKQAAVLARSD